MDGTESHRDRGRGHQASAWLPLAAVAAGGAFASYVHSLAVCRAAEHPGPVAFVVAGLADPTLYAASRNIVTAARRGEPLPRWSVASAVVASVVTLGMNVFSSDPRAVPPWLVNAWVVVAVLMAIESLTTFTRRGRGADGVRVPAAQSQPEATPQPPEPPAAEPTREWLDGHLQGWLKEMSPRELEVALGISRGRITAATAIDPPAPVCPPAGAGANGNHS
jgi:hypothetical protein